jgi:hypothetical protein
MLSALRGGWGIVIQLRIMAHRWPTGDLRGPLAPSLIPWLDHPTSETGAPTSVRLLALLSPTQDRLPAVAWRPSDC